MDSSLSKRTIFPQVNSTKFCEEESVDVSFLQKQSENSQVELDLNNETFVQDTEDTDYKNIIQMSENWSSADRNKILLQKLELDMKRIQFYYDNKEIQYVITHSKSILKQLSNLQISFRFEKSYKNKFRRFLGMAYIHRFGETNKIDYLKKARLYLCYNEVTQTPYKKAKRLNNLGLCQLLQNQSANSYHYFARALQIYKQDKTLNLLGLLKNISELYKQWQMYDVAIEIYKEMLEQSSKSMKKLTQNEQHLIKISILQCSNLCEVDPCRTANFHRAYQLISKVKSTFLNVKLRLEIMIFSVRWGIKEELIHLFEVQNLMKQVQCLRTEDLKIKYLQAYCYYVYRELFYGRDWDTYRQYTEFADLMFLSIYASKQKNE